MNVAVNVPSSSRWSPEETQLRIELAAAYRLTAKLGLDDLVYTHLSARVPGPENHFLLNPYGLMFDEITASSLIKVDVNGEVVDAGTGQWLHNPAGFVLHSSLHRSGDERACVFHCHSVNAIAVSSLECGLIPMSLWALSYYDRLAYHDYEGPPVRLDERDRIIARLGDHQAMLLRNHGILTTGRTCAEAFIYMYYLERACEIQVKAQSTGQKIVIPSPDICEYTASLRYSDIQHTGNPGAIEWQALMRKLDREDPSYRD
ncbi:class II aldolase/adducin family protein [Xanthobacter pseudotagetidis]|uniref:class II aldolase/adducin family protein n=1 Tax=Xanthobacter pseudotagetidis TaxID=3119911 RepID=UPI003727D760